MFIKDLLKAAFEYIPPFLRLQHLNDPDIELLEQNLGLLYACLTAYQDDVRTKIKIRSDGNTLGSKSINRPLISKILTKVHARP